MTCAARSILEVSYIFTWIYLRLNYILHGWAARYSGNMTSQSRFQTRLGVPFIIHWSKSNWYFSNPSLTRVHISWAKKYIRSGWGHSGSFKLRVPHYPLTYPRTVAVLSSVSYLVLYTTTFTSRKWQQLLNPVVSIVLNPYFPVAP